MTQKESVLHWQQGAKDSLRAAEVLYQDRKYALTLFHCHLAVEKALKALYVRQHDEAAPYTHNLRDLAAHLSLNLSDGDQQFLKELTQFAVDARYSDPVWAEEQATQEKVKQWLDRSQSLLLTLL